MGSALPALPPSLPIPNYSGLTALQLAEVVVHVVRADGAEEVHVVVAVEPGHLRVVDEGRALRCGVEREGEREGEGVRVLSEAWGRGPGAGGRAKSAPAHATQAAEATHEDVHLLVEVVVDDEVVRHPHAVRLHGVALRRDNGGKSGEDGGWKGGAGRVSRRSGRAPMATSQLEAKTLRARDGAGSCEGHNYRHTAATRCGDWRSREPSIKRARLGSREERARIAPPSSVRGSSTRSGLFGDSQRHKSPRGDEIRGHRKAHAAQTAPRAAGLCKSTSYNALPEP